MNRDEGDRNTEVLVSIYAAVQREELRLTAFPAYDVVRATVGEPVLHSVNICLCHQLNGGVAAVMTEVTE